MRPGTYRVDSAAWLGWVTAYNTLAGHVRSSDLPTVSPSVQYKASSLCFVIGGRRRVTGVNSLDGRKPPQSSARKRNTLAGDQRARLIVTKSRPI
jgi:hypothetical protein